MFTSHFINEDIQDLIINLVVVLPRQLRYAFSSEETSRLSY